MEFTLMRMMKREFARQNATVDLIEARDEQLDRIEALLRQQIDAYTLPSSPQLQAQFTEFMEVKEDIAQMKEDTRRIEGHVQHICNNTVDMPGLADQFNILAHLMLRCSHC